jgi:hypothetical protein
MADIVINGGDIQMSIGGNVIGYATSHTLSMSMSARQTSNKTSGIYTTREAGRLDVTAGCEGMGFYHATTGIQYLLGVIAARAPVALVFKETGKTASYATGNFLMTSAEVNAPDQDNVTYSVSFELANTFALGTFTP